MADSDSPIVFSQVDGKLTAIDNVGNSLEMSFVQTDISWVEEGAQFTEVRVRNKHAAIPQSRRTGDGNVTGSASLLISSLKGAAAVTPREALTMTGLASGWTPVGAGDRKMVKLRFDIAAGAAAGATQRVDFNYCVIANLKFDPAGANGLMMLSFDFTDLEESPTIT